LEKHATSPRGQDITQPAVVVTLFKPRGQSLERAFVVSRLPPTRQPARHHDVEIVLRLDGFSAIHLMQEDLGVFGDPV
jgi:hypothetical protein